MSNEEWMHEARLSKVDWKIKIVDGQNPTMGEGLEGTKHQIGSISVPINFTKKVDRTKVV